METPVPIREVPDPTSTDTKALAERTRKRVTWRLLPYLLLLYLIAYIDRTNISVAKLQMTGELNFDDAIIGFGSGIFFIGYFLLEIPGTIIVERWSARKWIARIMISWGIVATLMGFIGMWPLNLISNTQQFYWLRFILGLAEAGFFPGVVVYLSHWFQSEDRAKAKAKFMIGIPLASIIGVPLSSLIMEKIHWYNLAGWRWVFILEGIPSVILGIITLFYLTDKPHQAKWLPDDEKKWLVDELERERKSKEADGKASMWVGFKHPQIILLVTIYFFAVTSNYGLTFFFPSVVNKMTGLSTVSKTIVTTLPYIFTLIGMLVNGSTTRRSGVTRWHVVIPISLIGIGLILAILAGDFVAVAIAFYCLAGAGYTYHPSFWSLPSKFLTGAAAAASVGLINSVGNLGGFLGPYAFGYLNVKTGGHSAGMWFVAVCGIIAAVLALFIKVPPKNLPNS